MQSIIRSSANATDSFNFSVKKTALRELFEVSAWAALAKTQLFQKNQNEPGLSHLSVRLPELAFHAIAGNQFKSDPRVVLTFFSGSREYDASVTIECQMGSQTSIVELYCPDQILGLNGLENNRYKSILFNTTKGRVDSNLHELLPAISFAFERAIQQYEKLAMEHKQKMQAQENGGTPDDFEGSDEVGVEPSSEISAEQPV